MDEIAVHRIHKAVEAAKQAAHQATIEQCDIGDVDEVIETVDRELARPTPNKSTLTLMLNSLARSLLVAPSATETVQEIDRALRLAGLPATWNQ
jgi:hypothetical protein